MKYEVLTKPVEGFVYPSVISLDTEYSHLNFRTAELQSISIGVSPELTYILEDFSIVKGFIDAAQTIYTWNGVVDFYQIHKHFGWSFSKEKMFDGMLAEHLIDNRLNHSLGDYALREFNDNYKAEFWGMYESYQAAPKEVAYEYEMRDGCYTYRAGQRYSEILGTAGRRGLVEHVHKLQWVLFDTEIKGIKVNEALMRETKSTMSAKIDEFLPKLRSEFDEYCKAWEIKKWQEEIAKRKSPKGKSGVVRPTFSFASDKQVGELLFSGSFLGLDATEKTKKGNPSTSYDSLLGLAASHPELQTLVDYKETKAVYSTFVEGMIERIEDGRIYPGFYVNGTATGRISHNNPNMANLPRDGVIRNFFLPDSGHLIVGADYSQLEVVVEANLTEDKSLLKIILEGASKHDITAEGLGISRDQAKTLNFALQYGAGVYKVSKLLDVSNKAAQEIFDRYWQLYSGVKALKDATCKVVAETGQVKNLFGRVRHFDKPKNDFEKGKQERQSYNFLVQGVGADITNRATWSCAEFLSSNQLGRLLFSVHDELVCEAKEAHVEEAKDQIVKLMEEVSEYVKFKYPVKAVAYGPLNAWSKT